MNYLTYQSTQEAKIAYIESFKKVHGHEPKNVTDKSRAWFCLQNSESVCERAGLQSLFIGFLSC